MTVVKICGLRDVEHMAAAAEAGADLVGLNFLPTVRRYVPPETGAELASAFREKHQGPRLVGLFADQPVEHVNAVAKLVGLDLVQLCGSEPPEYWARVEPLVIKVVHVPTPASGDTDDEYAAVETVEARLHSINDAGHMALLDRQSRDGTDVRLEHRAGNGRSRPPVHSRGGADAGERRGGHRRGGAVGC